MITIGKVTEHGIEKMLLWSPATLSIVEEFDGRTHPTDLCGIHTVEDAVESILSNYDEPDVLVDQTCQPPEA